MKWSLAVQERICLTASLLITDVSKLVITGNVEIVECHLNGERVREAIVLLPSK